MSVPICELARAQGYTAPCFDPRLRKFVGASRQACIPRIRENCAANTAHVVSEQELSKPTSGTDPIAFEGDIFLNDERVLPEEMV